MNTQLLTLTKPQLIFTNNHLPRELGDGLVLRFVTPADVEALAQFNGRIHGSERPDHFDPMVAAWTRDFCSEQHPTCGPSNVFLVEDTRAGKIVSSMCLIPQTWTYAGIPFEVGRPEAVGTDPDYRRRGLIRAQFEVLHAKSAAMGHMVQGITGIAWYYRQFGYEYALDLGGGRLTYWQSMPTLKEGETEPYHLRPMTPDDLPLVKALYEKDYLRSMVACPRPDWLWRAMLEWYSSDSFERRNFQIIETAEDRAIGYVVPNREMWDDIFMIDELVVVEGQSLRAVMPSVLRALKPMADADAAKQNKTSKALFWKVGREHPVFDAIPELAQKPRLPYGWYLRVADVPAFLRHIALALEVRLARSTVAGYTGEIKINEYRGGFKMVWDKGKLVTVEPWLHEIGQRDDSAGFPPLVFLQLLFGRASILELRTFYPDCWASDEATVLLDALFPKAYSCVIPVG
jgi:predicted acetyltransferase